MLIGPYLPDGLQIQLTTPLVSRSYLGITAAVMASFGVDGVTVADDVVTVPVGRYRPTRYTVEPDASSASYPLAAAIAGGTVHVAGLTDRSLQGDARFAHVLGDMGCEVVVDGRGTTVSRLGGLRGIDIDMVDLSDLVPTLAVVAPFAVSPTTIRGVGFIRGKESDRLGDLCRELRAAGVRATETDDGLVVEPGSARRPPGDPPRPPAGDVVRTARSRGRRDRDRRPGRGVEELARLLVDARGPPMSGSTVVAAFDVDGTLTVRDCVRPFLERLAGRRGLVFAAARRPITTVTVAARRDR